jgi:hypothetical protein
MASRGHRVIGMLGHSIPRELLTEYSPACAQYLLPEDNYPVDYAFSKNDGKYPSSAYCFVGLVSLEDPPKHGVREAIGTLCVLLRHRVE